MQRVHFVTLCVAHYLHCLVLTIPYMNEKIMKSMKVCITKATNTIASSMGSNTKISVQETTRILLLVCIDTALRYVLTPYQRHFARKERPDLFDASKVKAKTRKPTKRARLDGDNFVVNSQVTTVSSSTIPILPIPSGATDTEHDSQNVETEEPESKAIAWASGFTEWINGKINGTPGKEEGLGASFIDSKWHKCDFIKIVSTLMLILVAASTRNSSRKNSCFFRKTSFQTFLVKEPPLSHIQQQYQVTQRCLHLHPTRTKLRTSLPPLAIRQAVCFKT